MRPEVRAASAAWWVERLGSTESPVAVNQRISACRTASRSSSASAMLRSGAFGVAVEVQREVVGREDLAERHGCLQRLIDADVTVVDAETGELVEQVAAERVVADARNEAHVVAEAGCGDGDVGGTASEEFAEGLDGCQADTGLQRIDVHAESAHGQHLGGGSVARHRCRSLLEADTICPDNSTTELPDGRVTRWLR
ncbi:hypothetical protein QE388_001064 [Microbacterium sp. SORGH_AS 969]|nr:hypothetical protein [Microbacterium sp. SORGH_AS_0969]